MGGGVTDSLYISSKCQTKRAVMSRVVPLIGISNEARHPSLHVNCSTECASCDGGNLHYLNHTQLDSSCTITTWLNADTSAILP